MQVYREIPIITNQPGNTEKQQVTHHLFSYKSILEKSNLAQWLEDSVPLIKDILQRNKTPILVGGTGMYLKAIVEGISPIPEIPEDFRNEISRKYDALGAENFYKEFKNKDPQAAKQIKPHDKIRITRAYEVIQFTGKSIHQWQSENEKFFPEHNFNIIFLNKNRDDIYRKINARFENMLKNGVLEEAEKASNIFDQTSLNKTELEALPAYKAHGLREVISYIKGSLTIQEAIKMSQQATRNYAKRQFTWWRGWSKKLIDKPNIKITEI